MVKGFTTGLGLIFKPVNELVSSSQPDRDRVPQEVFDYHILGLPGTPQVSKVTQNENRVKHFILAQVN